MSVPMQPIRGGDNKNNKDNELSGDEERGGGGGGSSSTTYSHGGGNKHHRGEQKGSRIVFHVRPEDALDQSPKVAQYNFYGNRYHPGAIHSHNNNNNNNNNNNINGGGNGPIRIHPDGGGGGGGGRGDEGGLGSGGGGGGGEVHASKTIISEGLSLPPQAPTFTRIRSGQEIEQQQFNGDQSTFRGGSRVTGNVGGQPTLLRMLTPNTAVVPDSFSSTHPFLYCYFVGVLVSALIETLSVLANYGNQYAGYVVAIVLTAAVNLYAFCGRRSVYYPYYSLLKMSVLCSSVAGLVSALVNMDTVSESFKQSNDALAAKRGLIYLGVTSLAWPLLLCLYMLALCFIG